jgi:PAS domain S-box-containing protein
MNDTPKSPRDNQFRAIVDNAHDAIIPLERKRLEENTGGAQCDFETIVAMNHEGILAVNSDGVVQYANPAAAELLGCSLTSLLGQPFGYPVPSSNSTEIDVQGTHGEMRIVQISAHATSWGKAPCALVILHDITELRLVERKHASYADQLEEMVDERTVDLEAANKENLQIIERQKTAERLLLEANAHNVTILASIASGMIEVDDRDYITYFNFEAERIFGTLAIQALGKPLVETIALIESESFFEKARAARHVGQKQMVRHMSYIGVDGAKHILDFSICPISGHDTHERGLLIVIDDITDMMKLEHELRQSQKLEAVGQLAAGIAHEINTPTQFIGDNTQFLQGAFSDFIELLKHYRQLEGRMENETDRRSLLNEISEFTKEKDIDYLIAEIPKAIEQNLEGLRRVADIVRAMREFSHPGSTEREPADLNQAIRNTVTVARNEWKYVADVRLELDDNLPLVPCRVAEINQVLLNLIVNAAQAIKELNVESIEQKGKITIRSRGTAHHFEIQVHDNGKAIPPAIRHRIFEPFFTTKPVGQGSGQGLAIAYAIIVTAHSGTIEVESAQSEGTTFVISLPLETPRIEDSNE